MQSNYDKHRARLAVYVLLPAWLWLGAVWAPAASGPNSGCLECHGDKSLTTTNAAGKEVSLFVDEAKLARTIHKTNTCASCHADISEKHPDDNVAAKPVNCGACHPPEARDYATSIHGVSHTLGASGAARLHGLPWHAQHPAGQERGFPGVQTEPAGDVRLLPQQPRARAGTRSSFRRLRRSIWTAFMAGRC